MWFVIFVVLSVSILVCLLRLEFSRVQVPLVLRLLVLVLFRVFGRSMSVVDGWEYSTWDH